MIWQLFCNVYTWNFPFHMKIVWHVHMSWMYICNYCVFKLSKYIFCNIVVTKTWALTGSGAVLPTLNSPYCNSMLSYSCGIKGLIKCNIWDPLWNLSWFRTGTRRMCVSMSCLSTGWTLVLQSNNTTMPLHCFICVLYIPYIQRTQDHWHCWICHVNWPNAIHISVCNLIHPIQPPS